MRKLLLTLGLLIGSAFGQVTDAGLSVNNTFTATNIFNGPFIANSTATFTSGLTLNGTALSTVTGSGNIVLASNPSITNPTITGGGSLTGTFSGNAAFTGLDTGCSFNGVLTVASGCFTGADLGAQINTAYATCPARGCVIAVPPGAYSFSTPILFGLATGGNSGIPVVLKCEGSANGLLGTVGSVSLTYTGGGSTAAISFDDGGYTGSGMIGCTLIGPAKAGGTAGLVCGSTNGLNGATANGVCIGHHFANNDISGFGYGIQQGGIASFLNTFLDNTIHDNGKNLNLTNDGVQAPGNEMNKFIGGLFSEQAISPANCIDTSGSTTPYDESFIGVSLDQCNVTMVGSGTRFRFVDSHLEMNSAFASPTAFITIGSSCSTCNLQLDSTDIIEDGTGTGRVAFIVNNNTAGSPAGVFITGGKFFGGGEASIPIVSDTNKTNLASIFNPYKAGAVTTDINNGIGFSTLEFNTLTLGSTIAGTTYAYPVKIAQETRDNAGCTTPAVAGNSCVTPITAVWAVPWSDTNYSVTCTGRGITNVPGPVYVVSKGVNQVVVNYQSINGGASSFTFVDCIGMHD